MGIELLTERLKDQIAGVLGCWDRVLIFGTLPKICYAEGMTSYLYAKQVRIFDYPNFAEPFRDRLRENAGRLAAAAGIEIEFMRKRNVRKEDVVKAALAKRGEQPGLVCILSAMEPCSTYTSHGTTKPPARHSCGRTMASACTTTSISSTKSWDYATCGSRPGCPAGYRSISTGTTGWRLS
jgi:hypothetical protein